MERYKTPEEKKETIIKALEAALKAVKSSTKAEPDLIQFEKYPYEYEDSDCGYVGRKDTGESSFQIEVSLYHKERDQRPEIEKGTLI